MAHCFNLLNTIKPVVFLKDGVYSLTCDLSKYQFELSPFLQNESVRYQHIKNEKRLLQKLAGRSLLENIYNQINGHKLIGVELSKFGKPFISDNPDFNFSISHSGDKVICVASLGRQIGVDLECHKPMRLAPFIEVLHPNEIELIITSKNPWKKFYYIWTRKEAFLKALGFGLLKEPSSIDCTQSLLIFDNASWILSTYAGHSNTYSICCQAN